MPRTTIAPVTITKRSPHVRSAISNGTKLPGGVSAGSAEGRRFRDLIHDLTAQMGGDLGPAEALQVQTCAGLLLHVERLQGEMLNGREVDPETITRASNSASRILIALRSRSTAPKRPAGAAGLRAYLATKAADQ